MAEISTSPYKRTGGKQRQVPGDLSLREGGRWRGGVGVMVSLCLCLRAKWTSHFVPEGTTANSTEYLNVIKNIYAPDCHQYYGVPPDCIAQQDGVSSHASNMAQGYFRREFPKFWAKGERPPDSPELNP